MGRIVKLTESDLKRIVKRVLQEQDDDGGDNRGTESKNPGLGGALGMFDAMKDAGKMKVEKRKKDMISTIKKSEDVLMKLLDLHNEYQTKDNIKNYFEKFKDESIDAYEDFYRNPDISESNNNYNNKQ